MPDARRLSARLLRVLRDPAALRRAVARRLPGRARDPGRERAPRRTTADRVADPSIDAPSANAPDAQASPRLPELAVAAAGYRIEALRDAPPAEVIVPIVHQPERARATLRSVLASTDPATPIVVVGSGAGSVVADLDAPDHHIRAVDGSDTPWAALVAGIAATSGDLAVLAPGVQVGPGWLAGLRYAAHARPDAGTATPLSDLPAPEHLQVGWDGRLPDGVSVAEVARGARRGVDPGLPPSTPIGASPAVYVRRAALDERSVPDPRDLEDAHVDVGDVVALVADLTARLARAGRAHLVDARTWVHLPADTTDDLGAPPDDHTVPAIDRRRHPDLDARWAALRYHDHLRDTITRARARVRDLQAGAARPRPRILYVVHEGDGGTPATAWDLARHVIGDAEPLVLTSDTQHLRLWQLDDAGEPTQIEHTELPAPLEFLSPSDPAYRAEVERLIVHHGVETVHVRHVYRHTLDLPEVAAALGCRVLLSLHDSYLICPTIHLLDDHGRFCGGVCTPGVGRCHVGPHWLRPAADELKHGYVHEWRRLVSRMLDHVDLIVTTSTSMRDLFITAYPDLDTPIHIIEHGRDLAPHPLPPLASGPKPLGRPLRVLVPGFLAHHKGGDVLRRIAELDHDAEVEFHLLGHVEKAYRDVGIDHGRYGRDDFRDRAASIDPDVAAILSICAESYCHTLTESWAAGLPVVGTRLGAVGERLERDGGGWIVDIDDPASILALFRDLRREPRRIATEARRIDAARFIPAAEMAADYLDVYAPSPQERLRVAVLTGRPPAAAAGLLEPLRQPTSGIRAVAVPGEQASLIAARIDRYDAVVVAADAPIGDEAARALADAVTTHETTMVVQRPTSRTDAALSPRLRAAAAATLEADEALVPLLRRLLASETPAAS